MLFSLEQIATKLAVHPPDTRFDKDRFKLFEDIDRYLTDDSMLHSGKAYSRGRRRYLVDNPVKRLYESLLLKALDQIERARIDDGLMVWQFYNMGYVVKTPTVTMGFDVIKGLRSYQWEWDVPDWIVSRLAGCLDVLFVTHQHRDHCDKDIVNQMLKTGKPVFVPEDCGVRFRKRGRLTYAGHHAGYNLLGLQVTSYRGRLSSQHLLP